jgi:MerR family transcriptional regulator/heat shock protein HspR
VTPRVPERRQVDRTRGVYMISVAAELAGMHPQTLRIYETRGLITPQRSPKRTRLYSADDVERLRRIQELTSQLGVNLAGVEKVFELEGELARRVGELERELERSRRRIRALELEAERTRTELEAEVERVRRSYRRELVRYEPQGQALVPLRGASRGGVGL